MFRCSVECVVRDILPDDSEVTSARGLHPLGRALSVADPFTSAWAYSVVNQLGEAISDTMLPGAPAVSLVSSDHVDEKTVTVSCCVVLLHSIAAGQGN
jgi:hypothetical protein